ncbi:uncharacterized protein LOC134209895 [Armigeres subalbatus]|uniref:uncharacterized protein LOC134209895 n=1 Tax=Armigeres subalbatus TaxID=124917 RepID=UPI002ED63182
MIERALFWWHLLMLCKVADCNDPDELLKSSILTHGYPAQLHKIITEDGYILTTARIPNPGKTPLLIMHGLFGCSADFTVQGPKKALAFLAHDAGFDIWMANNRGTTYSKRHESLNPKSRAYWRFSFHELGLYDLSANVDYILKTTKRRKLHYVSHSQGSTQFVVLTSLRPDYNDVFISAHLSAPVCFIHHSTTPAVVLTKHPDEIEAACRLTGMYEISGRGNDSYIDAIVRATQKGVIPVDLVLINVWYAMGFHDSINRTMFVDMLKYTPAGGSVYQPLHYIQLYNSKNFQQYDFGSVENMKRYGSARPPAYPVHKITTPIYVYHGEFDNINHPLDVKALTDRLPNLRLKYMVPIRRWNHIDFLYANSAHRLYQMILSKLLNTATVMSNWLSCLQLLLAGKVLVRAIDPNEFLKSTISRHNYPVELHPVTSPDGYHLTMARIPNPNRPILFLMHSFLSSSSDYTALGPHKSLAFSGFDSGFDVWLANARGNTFSRAHRSMNPSQKQFWDFSFHEVATQDIPAMINYVLNATGRTKVHYVGHSQGGTNFLAMASMLPEINGKIGSAHLSSPVAFWSRNTTPMSYLYDELMSLISILERIGMYEIGGRSPGSVTHYVEKLVKGGCVPEDMVMLGLGMVVGEHRETLNRTMLDTVMNVFPAGASLRQGLHFLQTMKSKRFSLYDFGEKENMVRYEKAAPPDYPLEKITAPVALYYGMNDPFVAIKDLEELAGKLPNLVLKQKMADWKWNHIDFIYGSHGNEAHQVVIKLVKELESK